MIPPDRPLAGAEMLLFWACVLIPLGCVLLLAWLGTKRADDERDHRR